MLFSIDGVGLLNLASNLKEHSSSRLAHYTKQIILIGTLFGNNPTHCILLIQGKKYPSNHSNVVSSVFRVDTQYY